MITPDTAADAFAQWLMTNEPQLFNALLARTPQSLSGWSDILSNVAGGISVAAKNVGSFLVSEDGMKTLSGLTSVYLQTQMQKDAVKIQLRQAQQGQPPAPIQTQVNPSTGQIGAFYYPPNTAPVPLTPSFVQQLLPPQQYWPIAAGAGVLLLLGLFFFRR